MNDVVVMRVILVALLILYHSFAPFSGNWDPIYSFDSPVYFWIGKFGYSFFLEAFVFISGLLAGYQFVAGGGVIPRYMTGNLYSKKQNACYCLR